MPEIILTNVTKRYGDFYAVDNLNLKIDDRSFITLLGPSGCGKTTTLRMIAYQAKHYYCLPIVVIMMSAQMIVGLRCSYIPLLRHPFVHSIPVSLAVKNLM